MGGLSINGVNNTTQTTQTTSTGKSEENINSAFTHGKDDTNTKATGDDYKKLLEKEKADKLEAQKKELAKQEAEKKAAEKREAEQKELQQKELEKKETQQKQQAELRKQKEIELQNKQNEAKTGTAATPQKTGFTAQENRLLCDVKKAPAKDAKPEAPAAENKPTGPYTKKDESGAEISYDSYGKITKKTEFGEGNKKSAETTFDVQGKPLAKTEFGADGKKTSETKFDEKGQPKTQNVFFPDGENIEKQIEFTDGIKSKEKSGKLWEHTLDNKKVSERVIVEKSFDSEGNTTTIDESYVDRRFGQTSSQQVFDKNGKLKSITNSYLSYGQDQYGRRVPLNTSTQEIFDEKGNAIAEKTYLRGKNGKNMLTSIQDGKSDKKQMFKYDETGNCIQSYTLKNGESSHVKNYSGPEGNAAVYKIIASLNEV